MEKTAKANKVDVIGIAKAKFAEWRKVAKVFFGTGEYYQMLSVDLMVELEIVKAENHDMTEYIEEIGKYIAWVVFYHEKEKNTNLVNRYLILIAKHFGIGIAVDWCNFYWCAINEVVYKEIDRIINTEL